MIRARNRPNSKRRRARKRSLLARDGNVCQTCWGRFLPEELTMDHVKPWSKGGRNQLKNLQLLCAPCNQAKGNQWTQ